MKTKVGNNVQDTSSNFLTLVGNWLNDRLIEVMRRSNQNSLKRTDYQVSISSGTEDTVLPDDFENAISVLDLTNKQKLTQIDTQQWVSKYQNNINTNGQSVEYIILDDVVMNQPSSASVITFVSSSGADTTQTVYVRGVVSGSEDYETVTLNGASSVATTKSFTRIFAIGKDASTTGIVTVTSNSGAVSVATIARETLQTRYKKLRLVPTTNGAITLEIVYTQKALPMSQSYDYPLLDCEDILEAGATADAWKYKRQNAKADYWESIFEKRLDDWMWSKENQADRVHLFSPSTYPRN